MPQRNTFMRAVRAVDRTLDELELVASGEKEMDEPLFLKYRTALCRDIPSCDRPSKKNPVSLKRALLRLPRLTDDSDSPEARKADGFVDAFVALMIIWELGELEVQRSVARDLIDARHGIGDADLEAVDHLCYRVLSTR